MGRWVSYGLISCPDEFKVFLFKAIASLPDDLISRDMKLLRGRLSLRKNGKCVFGLQSKQWEIMLRQLKKIRKI